MEKPDFEHIDENVRTFWKEETEKFYSYVVIWKYQ